MVTVSGSKRLTLATMFFASAFSTACSILTPAGKQEEQAADSGIHVSGEQQVLTASDDRPTSVRLPQPAGNTEQRSQQVFVPATEAPLPRQAYGAGGEKIPYLPRPNPYTSAAVSVPAEARSIFVVASSLQRQGKQKAAQAQFQKLTEKYPTLSGAWMKLGNIEEKNGDYDNAITHYARAISVNRNNVNAYMALGLLQRRQGNFSDAQQTYLAALEVWRDFPEAHLNLAILYDLYANMPEEAQKHYEAYDFLTGARDEKVHKWLVEVKRRTGIESSFIDNPPKGPAEVPATGEADAGVAVATGGT